MKSPADNDSVVSGATITVNNKSMVTNIFGYSLINDCANSIKNITISKTGFCKETLTKRISEESKEDTVLLRKIASKAIIFNKSHF